jgi:hypothetical protein
MANAYPKPPFSRQKQPVPGLTSKMTPVPDHGEASYKGSGRLNGKRAVITGGDSGIGRAVAIAYAREGADILIAYLEEDEDACATKTFSSTTPLTKPASSRSMTSRTKSGS